MNIDWSIAGTAIISGLAAALLMFFLLGSSLKSSGKPSAQPKSALAPAPMAAPIVQQGIEEEIVAAITAAVYVCMQASAPGASYEIKSISRAVPGRSVWGFAGMQHNTRPF